MNHAFRTTSTNRLLCLVVDNDHDAVPLTPSQQLAADIDTLSALAYRNEVRSIVYCAIRSNGDPVMGVLGKWGHDSHELAYTSEQMRDYLLQGQRHLSIVR